MTSLDFTLPIPLPVPRTDQEAAAPWWTEAAIYQVYVRSFADGNGDGIGDLLGVRSRLRYLADLGVDALWLTPFYLSPMADGGYDVADYRDVDPMFGRLSDADALVRDAHLHGLKVIVDIVPNHTSSRHVWFQEALISVPARDRYLFRTGKGEHGELPPNDWESIFGGPAWTRVEDGQWYLHLFDSTQPDLNWDNDEVKAEFESVLRFWLDLGVDGFRIDVAHGLVKADGLPDAGSTGQALLVGQAELPYFDQEPVHEIYRRWRQILDSYDGERIGVAEAWVPTAERLARYLRPDELHQAFNFHYLYTEWSAAAFRSIIDLSLEAVSDVGAPSTWVLSNHDVARHPTRYGDGVLGLRRARAAALLTLALPGSVYVYQGEELGLPEVLDLPDHVLVDPVWERSGRAERGRDGCRVPLPWGGTVAPFGFGPPGSTGSWLPQPEAWRDLTVESQLGDPGSTLTLYRSALALRRRLDALGAGQMEWLETPEHPYLLGFRREPGFVCLVNLGDDPVTVDAPGVLLLGSGEPVGLDEYHGRVTLPGNTAGWWAAG